jgi:hypothetical protein
MFDIWFAFYVVSRSVTVVKNLLLKLGFLCWQMYYFQKRRGFTLAWKLYETLWMQVYFITPIPFIFYNIRLIHNDFTVNIYKTIQSMSPKCIWLSFWKLWSKYVWISVANGCSDPNVCCRFLIVNKHINISHFSLAVSLSFSLLCACVNFLGVYI